MIIYITGLSGSGKTTIAKNLQKQIPHSIVLDGDDIRNTINSDLGFEKNNKIENIRRNNELIKLIHNQIIWADKNSGGYLSFKNAINIYNKYKDFITSYSLQGLLSRFSKYENINHI